MAFSSLYQLTTKDWLCTVGGPFSNMARHILHSPFSHLAISCVSVYVTELWHHASKYFFFHVPKHITMVLYQNTESSPGTYEATVSAAAKSRCCSGVLLEFRGESTGGMRNCRFCFLYCHWSNIWPSATHFIFPPVLTLYIAAVVNRDSRDFGRFISAIWDAMLMWSCALAN